jgi:hypothetical protein
VSTTPKLSAPNEKEKKSNLADPGGIIPHAQPPSRNRILEIRAAGFPTTAALLLLARQPPDLLEQDMGMDTGD